jgi:hypothetical protein
MIASVLGLSHQKMVKQYNSESVRTPKEGRQREGLAWKRPRTCVQYRVREADMQPWNRGLRVIRILQNLHGMECVVLISQPFWRGQ